MTTPPGSDSLLSPAAIRQGMIDTAKARALLQLCCQVIKAQRNIDLPAKIDKSTRTTVSKDLSEHQELARQNAEDYLSTINPLMLGPIAGITGFSNRWNNLQDFTNAMQALKKEVGQNASKCSSVIKDLRGFLPKVQQASRNHQGDRLIVENWMKGERGYQEPAHQEIGSLQGAIANNQAAIAQSSLMDVMSLVTIAVGAISGLPLMFVGGFKVVPMGRGGSFPDAIPDQMNNFKKLVNKLGELDEAQQHFNVVDNCARYVERMDKVMQDSIRAAEQLQKGWLSLQNEIDRVLASHDPNAPDPGASLKEQLETANSSWNDTAELARMLQEPNRGTLSLVMGTMPDLLGL